MSGADPNCRFTGQVAAWLQGELLPPQSSWMDGHVAHCAACHEEAGATRELLEDLRRTTSAPAVDLSARILAGCRERQTQARGRLGRLQIVLGLGVAACALVALRTVFGHPPVISSPPPAVVRESKIAEGVAWLLATQEPTGGWSAMRHGAFVEYDHGVSGLALLALLESGRTDRECGTAIERGISWLVREQGPEGRIGPSSTGTMYDHAPATLALIEAGRRHPTRELADAIDRALAYIVARQHREGGWGASEWPGGHPNVAATVWPVAVLEAARSRPGVAVDAALASAKAWLAQHGSAAAATTVSDPDGEVPQVPGSASRTILVSLSSGAGIPSFDGVAGAGNSIVPTGGAPACAPDSGRCDRRVDGDAMPAKVGAAAREGGRVYATSMSVLVASIAHD